MVDSTAHVPALSLVIPVYNAAQQLPATLDAVDAFATRYPGSVEVLFVDDHSTEVETQMILEDFTRQRGYARMRRYVIPPRRARSCPRAVRQPLKAWPRLLRPASTQGPMEFEVV